MVNKEDKEKKKVKIENKPKFSVQFNFSGICLKAQKDCFVPINSFRDSFNFEIECEEKDIDEHLSKLFDQMYNVLTDK